MYQLQEGPFWLTLIQPSGDKPAVKIQCKPISPKTWRKAHRTYREMIAEGGVEAADEAGEEFSKVIVRDGLLAWEGIGDASGEPVQPSPATVELFLQDPILFAAVDNLYVGPMVAREAEKNGFTPSPNGTSAAAKVIAPRAPRRAKSAPTKKTKRARTPAK